MQQQSVPRAQLSSSSQHHPCSHLEYPQNLRRLAGRPSLWFHREKASIHRQCPREQWIPAGLRLAAGLKRTAGARDTMQQPKRCGAGQGTRWGIRRWRLSFGGLIFSIECLISNFIIMMANRPTESFCFFCSPQRQTTPPNERSPEMTYLKYRKKDKISLKRTSSKHSLT